MVRHARAAARRSAASSHRDAEPLPSNSLSSPPQENPAALAAYIAEMVAELAQLARGADLPMLAYFLNLARVEAQIYARAFDDGEPVRGG